jgi:hypothetical protein
MPRSFDQILAGLAALKAEDFDYPTPGFDGNERLNELTDELMTLPQPERGVRALFDVMERMPEADLGSPGPLVHTLERMRGHYERELVESIKRRPTPTAIWMVNRILNATRVPEQRQFYMDLLRFAAEHPSAPEVARHEAQHFIEYQSGAA